MNRKVVAAVVSVMGLVALAACDGRPVLRVYGWTYYVPESIVADFEKEYGVRVTKDYYASNEEMLARVQAGGIDFDVIFPTMDFVTILIQLDKLERLDHTLLENMGNIDPAVLAKIVADPGMEFSVPFFYGAAGIIVNTAMVPDFERSWSIFGREDLKDRMTMLDDTRETMGAALVHLGYSVNSTDPEQIRQARDLINNSWRPNLLKFDSDAFGIGFANGNFSVVHGYPEGVFEEIAGNARLLEETVFFIPEEGGPAYIDSMVIPKGSKNIELAHKFIDFIHRPEVYAEFLRARNFPSTVNVPARELVHDMTPMFTVKDLENTEPRQDVGRAFGYFSEAWNAIRIE